MSNPVRTAGGRLCAARQGLSTALSWPAFPVGFILILLSVNLNGWVVARVVLGALGGSLVVGCMAHAIRHAHPDKNRPAPDNKPWKQLVPAGVAIALLALAIHLPLVPVNWLFGDTADVAEQAEAITWIRWALVILAVVVLALDRFRHLVELAVGLVSVLVAFAAGAGITALVNSLESTADATSTEPAYARGFVIPAAKVAPVPRTLAQDRCVRLILVTQTDPDPDERGNPVVYESSAEHDARLVADLDSGTPSAGVTVDLGGSEDPAAFATALTAAQVVYVVADDESQTTDDSAVETGCPP